MELVRTFKGGGQAGMHPAVLCAVLLVALDYHLYLQRSIPVDKAPALLGGDTDVCWPQASAMHSAMLLGGAAWQESGHSLSEETGDPRLQDLSSCHKVLTVCQGRPNGQDSCMHSANMA